MKKIHTNSITHKLCGSLWACHRTAQGRRGQAKAEQRATGPPIAQASWKQAGKLQLKASWQARKKVLTQATKYAII